MTRIEYHGSLTALGVSFFGAFYNSPELQIYRRKCAKRRLMPAASLTVLKVAVPDPGDADHVEVFIDGEWIRLFKAPPRPGTIAWTRWASSLTTPETLAAKPEGQFTNSV